MKRPTIKTVIADDEAELDAKTAAAQVRPPVQIDIEDYTAGGKLKLDPGEPDDPRSMATTSRSRPCRPRRKSRSM